MALEDLVLRKLALKRGPKNSRLSNSITSGEIGSDHVVHPAEHIKNDRG